MEWLIYNRPQLVEPFTEKFINEITFGVEIEPDYKNHPRLAYYYRPSSIPIEQWVNMSEEQRAERGYARCNVQSYKEDHDEWFYLIPEGVFENRKEIQGLPEKMHCDSPGSTEINGPIFNDINEFIEFMKSFTEEVGTAGSQGHVVFNKTYFEGMLGYILYAGERSLFRRAEEEYEKYLETGETPGSNFRANALGVMKDRNWDYFKDNIKRLKEGNLLRFKGTGYGKWSGPHIRETYGFGKLGFEIRQEDNPGTAPGPYKKGPERLVESMQRLHKLFTDKQSFIDFIPFEDIKIVSASRQPGMRWQSFKDAFYKRLEEIKNLNISNDLLDKAGELSEISQGTFYWRNWNVLKFSQNFLLPLRKWENYPIVKASNNQREIRNRILNSTLDYIETIFDLLQQPLTRGQEDEKMSEVNRNFQIAAAKWVFDIDLFPYFQRWERQREIYSPGDDDKIRIEYRY